MKGLFEGKGDMLYVPDCPDCLPLLIWRTWLVPCYSFVNLNGMKARMRNLILQWDKFPLYQSLAKRLINDSFRVFVSLYYKYITFKLNCVMANWLKMTDHKTRRLTQTYVVDDNEKNSCDVRGPGFYPVVFIRVNIHNIYINVSICSLGLFYGLVYT